MNEIFDRFKKIVDEDSFKKINKSTILVIGLGGVGGYVVESLVRSGIGKIIIVDKDTVDETNINRQIIALNSTIGLNKTDEFEKRIKDINPDCETKKITDFILKDNIDLLFEEKIDYLVDACDTTTTKKLIIDECLKRDVPFITCMGTGNRFDPSKLEIIDIRKTSNDPLARIIRKYVKDMKINKKVMCLCSKEIPVKTGDYTPGSTAFVPPSAGLLISSYIIREIIKK